MANSDAQGTVVLPVVPILGSIACAPATAVVDETVCVEVRDPDGKAYDNTETIPISINGVAGSKQYLSWSQPGTNAIVVLARRPGGKTEKMSTTVVVNPAPGRSALPALQVTWSPEAPTQARFSVVRSLVSLKAIATPVGTTIAAPVHPSPHLAAPPSPLPAPNVGSTTPVSAVSELPRATVTRISAIAKKNGRMVTAVGGPSVAIYTWEFSHGGPLGSTRSSIAYDFGPDLDPDRPYTVFHVAATVQDPGQAPVTLHRSLAVHNPYYMMKHRGVLQPPVAASEFNATFYEGAWHGTVTVRNPEPFDMTFTQHYFEFVRDGGRVAPEGPAQLVHATQAGQGVQAVIPAIREISQTLGPEPMSIVLKAKSSTRIDVALAGKRLPPDVSSFNVHFQGSAPNRMPVRVAATFDVPQQMDRRFHLSTAAAATLAKLATSGRVANPQSIKASELVQLKSAGLLDVSDLDALRASLLQTGADHIPPPSAMEGDECDPWNMPEVVPADMFCMPTPETRRVLMPARFMNAKKGDIILTPGDGSLISSVLSSVDPMQPYAHSGMMTRNRDEITHSTGSMDRMLDSDSGFVGSGGFRPDILKYVWPGAITQTVKHAVDGEQLVDPETGKPYTVGGFGSLQTVDDWTGQVSVAMVVKPDPLNETPRIRAELNGFADFAASLAGKCHYRFFCYTNPMIGPTTTAPNDAKWAAGTRPTVCSSLVWMSIRQSGMQIEGGLESADIAAGAQIAPGTPDGLYVYQADERLNAGEVLYGRIAHLARQAAGQLGAALTDIEDDLGNQILNSFATDWSDDDATESDAWKQTTDANAVSPQNLMFYDAPLYGYSEPLIYRDERFEEITIYRWKHVTQTGTVAGLVRVNGQPQPGADVQFTISQATHSAGDGKFSLPNIPIGTVVIEAQKVINDVLWMAKVNANVFGGDTTNVTIDLKPPAHLFRRIVIDGEQITTNYEFAAVYPRNSSDFNALADLDPGDVTHSVKTFDCVADDDTLGRLILVFDLNSDDSVTVKATIRCYDSNAADTDDYDEGSLDPFVLKAGRSGNWHMYVDGENRAEAWFTLRNEINQS